VPTKRSEGQPRSEEQRRSEEQPRSDERSGEVEPTTGAFDSTTLHEDTPSKVRKILKFNIDSILPGRPAAFQTSRADGGAVVHDSSFPTWVGMKCYKPTFWVDTVHSVSPFFFLVDRISCTPFRTQHQLHPLLLLSLSACSLSPHENLCSCSSPLAANCVAHLHNHEVGFMEFCRVGLQRREFSWVGSESKFTAFFSASCSIG
jgi:hypothetical protein